jgi:hypothetical protein
MWLPTLGVASLTVSVTDRSAVGMAYLSFGKDAKHPATLGLCQL